jgi:hypothetical protein
MKEDCDDERAFFVGLSVLDEFDVWVLRSYMLKVIHHSVMRGKSISWFVAEKLLWRLDLG